MSISEKTERVERLRKAFSIVADNAKRETLGKNGLKHLESNAIKRVLTDLLGEPPTEIEVERAQKF